MHRGLALALAVLLVSVHGRADEATPESFPGPATEAFDRGLDAYKAGRKAEAARWMARSDQLEPSDTILATALQAASESQSRQLAAELCERAKPRSAAALEKVVSAVCPELAQTLARIEPQCGPRDCQLEGQAPRAVYFLEPGEYVLSWSCDTQRKTLTVSAAAGATLTPSAECTPPAAKPAPRPQPTPTPKPGPEAPAADGGLSPTFFYVGLAATGVLAAITGLSALDVKNKHDDFEAGGRRDSNLKDAGESAQTRTNLLAVATVAVGVTTGVFGLLRVEEDGDHTAVLASGGFGF